MLSTRRMWRVRSIVAANTHLRRPKEGPPGEAGTTVKDRTLPRPGPEKPKVAYIAMGGKIEDCT